MNPPTPRPKALATALVAAIAALLVGAIAVAQPVRTGSVGVPGGGPAPIASHLPWRAGERVWVTQDCADTCCEDHVGVNTYAWDFAAHTPFDVVAPRAGTIVHAKFASDRGGDASQVDFANYLVIDHGDGTYSVMLHLAYNSLDPAVRCGGFVRAGQRLAVTGSTGWSSGNHLHYQVNSIPPGMDRTCECGADGMACQPEESHWELFWSSGRASATRPVTFAEWPGASQCGDRHDDNIQTSRNTDAGEAVVTLDDTAARQENGGWTNVAGGTVGRFLTAPAGTGARLFFPAVRDRVTPGVYAVWNAVPARADRRTGRAWVEVVGRGGRSRVEAPDRGPGGAYRPLAGRYKFTGREGEGVRVGDDGRPGEVVTADGVTLVRIADGGGVSAGGTCAGSTDCDGDLVCETGTCVRGCEARSCGEGSRCDVTGLCVPGTATGGLMANAGTTQEAGEPFTGSARPGAIVPAAIVPAAVRATVRATTGTSTGGAAGVPTGVPTGSHQGAPGETGTGGGRQAAITGGGPGVSNGMLVPSERGTGHGQRPVGPFGARNLVLGFAAMLGLTIRGVRGRRP